MAHLANKAVSEPNIAEQDAECLTTPPNYIAQRIKRKRENEAVTMTDLCDFKDEIKLMIQSMFNTQENELKKITPALMEIKQTNINIENSMSFLAEQNEELKKKIKDLQEQARKDKEYINLLEDKIEDIQRGSRKANIEIKNVPRAPKETKEDLLNMVLSLSKSINCKIEKSDIRDIYRVRGKKEVKGNSPIIVETVSAILKTEILKMTKTHNVKHKEKLCARHLGFTKNTDTPIYVSEQLTAKGARLFFIARDLAKSKAFKFCWTAYGRVYVRKNENTPIILIKNESQIHSLMQEK